MGTFGCAGCCLIYLSGTLRAGLHMVLKLRGFRELISKDVISSATAGCETILHALLQSFNLLSYSEKNIFVVELLKSFSLIGIVGNSQDSPFEILPLPRATQAPSSLLRKYSQPINPLLRTFDKLPDSCKAICLAQLVQLVSVTIVVGAFEATKIDSNSNAIRTLTNQPGCYIYPSFPADDVIEAVSNACQLSRVEDIRKTIQKADYAALEESERQILDGFEVLSYGDKLVYVSAMLRRTSLDGVVQGFEDTAFAFPLTRPHNYQGLLPLSEASLLRLFDEAPVPVRARCMATILKSIPVAIVIGAFAGESAEVLKHPEMLTGRYVFPASPIDEVLSALVNAYKTFGD